MKICEPHTIQPKNFYNARELRHNQTAAETRLWRLLRAHQAGGVHFRRQHAIGNYIVDFCAPHKKLIIELDGSQHLEQQDYDRERTAFLETRGYRVLRFWNSDVMKEPDAVMLTILDALEEPPPGLPQIQGQDLGEGKPLDPPPSSGF